ncbi:MAG: hypothetical protein K2J85_04085, partial [Anaeroplasmataceae bacterium]|nr:hypothetical protein [Anaeroplasmataceae bacterium]
IEHIVSEHKVEIEKDYDKYVAKIKEAIINPIDIKKVDNNKFYLYAFFTISKRNRKGFENPKIYMQTIIQKEKDSNFYTVVSAFPNIK